MNKNNFYLKIIANNIKKYNDRFDLLFNKKLDPLYNREEGFLYNIFHDGLFMVQKYIVDKIDEDENYIISEKELKLEINKELKNNKYHNYSNVRKQLFKELFGKNETN